MRTQLCAVGILYLATLASPAWAADVSKLVTQAEVESALGVKVTSEVNKLPPPMGGTQVIFTSSSIPVKSYTLTMREDKDIMPKLKMTAAQNYASMKNMGKTTPLTIPGGEGFTWGTTTEVLKKGIYLSGSTMFGDSKKAEEIRNSLTKKAAERL